MRASGYDYAQDAYYVEPRWAIDALLDVETFEGTVWDPSCGGGNIPIAMAKRGLSCWGSDIANRGFGLPNHCFFSAPETANNIVSNPPFDVIEPYIVRALEKTTKKVALLARLALLEGIKRRKLFLTTPLARVWVSSRRISMPPGGTDIPAKGGSVAYAWFVWDKAHTGPATVGWLS